MDNGRQVNMHTGELRFLSGSLYTCTLEVGLLINFGPLLKTALRSLYEV